MKTAGTKRALLLSLSGIGNYLMQSVAIRALRQAYPQWDITVWVAPRGTKALAMNDPNIDHVIERPMQGSYRDQLIFIRKLAAAKFDTGLVLSPGQLLKSAAYLFLSRIPKRIGHTYPFLGMDNTSFLLTDAIREVSNTHDIGQNVRLLEKLGVSPADWAHKNYVLHIPDEAHREAQTLMQGLRIPSDKPLIGIHAGCAPSFLWKRWPLENFAAIAKELIVKRNMHILLFGGPDEEEQKQHLKKLIENQLPVTSYQLPVTIVTTSLLTTAALMQQCQFVLSNDSGLMHLAAASGVTVYGLFGPTNEKETGPRGAQSFVIRAAGTFPMYNTEHSFDLGDKPHSSLLALTPDQVLAEIQF